MKFEYKIHQFSYKKMDSQNVICNMPAILFRLQYFNSLLVKAKTNPWMRALFVKHFSTDSW